MYERDGANPAVVVLRLQSKGKDVEETNRAPAALGTQSLFGFVFPKMNVHELITAIRFLTSS